MDTKERKKLQQAANELIGISRAVFGGGEVIKDIADRIVKLADAQPEDAVRACSIETEFDTLITQEPDRIAGRVSTLDDIKKRWGENALMQRAIPCGTVGMQCVSDIWGLIDLADAEPVREAVAWGRQQKEKASDNHWDSGPWETEKGSTKIDLRHVDTCSWYVDIRVFVSAGNLQEAQSRAEEIINALPVRGDTP